MDLDAPAFVDPPSILPAAAANDVVLDERVVNVYSFNAADPAIGDRVPPHNVLSALGEFRPGRVELVADVDPELLADVARESELSPRAEYGSRHGMPPMYDV